MRNPAHQRYPSPSPHTSPKAPPVQRKQRARSPKPEEIPRRNRTPRPDVKSPTAEAQWGKIHAL